MKNFFSILKTKLNTVFTGAELGEEATESEVLDFLEAEEGRISESLSTVETQVEAATVEVSRVSQENESLAETLSQLATAIQTVNDNQVAMNGRLDDFQKNLNSVKVGVGNLPRQKSGDPAPVQANSEDENVFTMGKIAGDILKNVKSLS